MKVWHIQTWGGGTPHYMVAAETKIEAWEMVTREWRKLNFDYYVGGDRYDRSGKHQNMDDLVEIEGISAEKPMIIDLHEDWYKQKSNGFVK